MVGLLPPALHQQCSNDSLALVFSSRPIKMSPRFILGRENVPCIAEVVNRLLKAGCTDFTFSGVLWILGYLFQLFPDFWVSFFFWYNLISLGIIQISGY